MNEEIEIEIKQSENRLKWAKFWRSTIQWLLKFLKIGSVAAVGAASGYSGASYYHSEKHAEITPQKSSEVSVSHSGKKETQKSLRIIHETQIIKEKIDYAKVQEMINKAMQAHIRQYHE